MKPLFSPRRILQFSQDTIKPSGFLGPRQWVVSRSLCFYKRFFLGNIPDAEKNTALDLMINRWSPFGQTGRYIVWKHNSAMVWIWDEKVRTETSASTGGGKWPVVPETLLVDPEPARENVLSIVSCMEGVEVQVWKDSVLCVSRWWKEMPDQNEWKKFLLSNDLDPTLPMPAPIELTWTDKPWAKSSDKSVSGIFKNEKLLVHAVFFAIIFWLTWNSVAGWRYYQSNKNLATQVNALSTQIDPILDARTQALDQKDKVAKLQTLLSAPSQASIMATVARVIPAKKARLWEWHYSRGKLLIMIEGQNQNPLAYVKKLQAIPMFKNVTVTQGKNEKILNISVDVVKD